MSEHKQDTEIIEEVLKIIRDSGGEAYLVGGCVRDILLGRKPNDYDITTNLMPDEVKELFPRTVHEKGEKHLTVMAIVHGNPIEITTYRKDSNYSDGRHPDDVIPAKTIQEDLARRDFTINALALDYEKLKRYYEEKDSLEQRSHQRN